MTTPHWQRGATTRKNADHQKQPPDQQVRDGGHLEEPTPPETPAGVWQSVPSPFARKPAGGWGGWGLHFTEGGSIDLWLSTQRAQRGALRRRQGVIFCHQTTILWVQIY